MLNFGKTNMLIQQFSAKIFLVFIMLGACLYLNELIKIWESSAIYIAETYNLLRAPEHS